MTQLTLEPIRALRPLTDEERLEAMESAHAVVVRRIGVEPSREQFAGAAISNYPPAVLIIVGVVLALVFVGAALPSLFRLFTAGRDYFMYGQIKGMVASTGLATLPLLTTSGHGINDAVQAAIVGVATFLLSEFLIILSTVVARVFFTGRERLLFAVPIILGLLMALVGNYVVQKPNDPFGWLETITPPIAVLFIAFIGERLMLDAIATRHGRELAYQAARNEWQERTAEPEKSEYWRGAYINALKARLMEVNVSGQGATARRELMNGMGAADWRPVLLRELNADRWHEGIEEEQPPAPPVPLDQPRPPLLFPIQPTNGNGHHPNGIGGG